MNKLVGVILAAGLSSRMGRFKPMLEIGGKSMVRRVVELMQNAGADPVIVVTGHRHEELETHLSRCGVQFVYNPDYASTQQIESLQLALTELPRDCTRVLISPADIPLVRQDTVRRLLAAEGEFIRPNLNGKSGHPVILGKGLIPFVRKYDGPGGLNGAVKQSGIAIRDVSVNDANVLIDNDTLEDYWRTLARFGEVADEKAV